MTEPVLFRTSYATLSNRLDNKVTTRVLWEVERRGVFPIGWYLSLGRWGESDFDALFEWIHLVFAELRGRL